MMDRPSNTDSPAIRTGKERELSAAFMQYLSSTGEAFETFNEEREEFELIMVSLIKSILQSRTLCLQLATGPYQSLDSIWECNRHRRTGQVCSHSAKGRCQSGRVWAGLFGHENQTNTMPQSPRPCEAGKDDEGMIILAVPESKLTKYCKVGADIKSEHQSHGLLKKRGKRAVHKSTTTLLAVPR